MPSIVIYVSLTLVYILLIVYGIDRKICIARVGTFNLFDKMVLVVYLNHQVMILCEEFE